MKLDKKARIRARGFIESFHHWSVHDDWVQELYNYFIMGYPPGSFHTACFANDLYRASCTTHISNRWEDIAAMMKWLGANAPEFSWGNHTQVEKWLTMTQEERNIVLLKKGWIISDKEVTWKLLEEA